MNKEECIQKFSFELLKHYSKIANNYIPDEFSEEINDKDPVTINFVLNIMLAFNKLIIQSLIEHYNISNISENLVEIIENISLSLKEEFGLKNENQ